jgi:D-arabinose 1-dehydrogenase-like Zn-dependent alcohol dehydrogenase
MVRANSGSRRLNRVRSVLPLEKVADGYQRMVANQARFRVVLTTAH